MDDTPHGRVDDSPVRRLQQLRKGLVEGRTQETPQGLGRRNVASEAGESVLQAARDAHAGIRERPVQVEEDVQGPPLPPSREEGLPGQQDVVLQLAIVVEIQDVGHVAHAEHANPFPLAPLGHHLVDPGRRPSGHELA